MSELKVDKITPRQGTTLTLGDSGDTINFGSGVLPNFENLTVTGDLTVDTNSLKVDSTNNRVGIGTASPSVALDVVGAITATGNITGTLATAAQPNITSLGTLTGLTTTGDINFGDNDKAVFGAGSDLEIYHNGSHSIIEDVGTGKLEIRSNGTGVDIQKENAEFMARFITDGGVELYHDHSKKLETTSTGVDVTGTVTATGNLTSLGIDDNATTTSLTISSDGRTTLDATNEKPLVVHHTDGSEVKLGFSNNAGSASYMSLASSDFTFNQVGSETMRINSSGQVIVGGTSAENSSVRLEAQDATNPILQVKDTTSNIICGIQAGNAEAVIRCPQDSPLVFNVGASETERMRIDSSGKVIIAEDYIFAGSGETISPGAWVKFTGTGTVTINDDFNVSSISDVSSGQYDVNFSTSCQNASYAVTGTSTATNHSGWNVKSTGIQNAPTHYTVASIRITTENTDSNYVSFIAFGDWE